ncbi:MAG: urate hydroxylase PuuD [Ferruginibacter sp.]
MLITGVILFIIAFSILIVLVIMSYKIRRFKIAREEFFEELGEEDKNAPKILLSQDWIYALIVIVTALLIFNLYIFLKDTIYAGHLMEWLNIIVRLMHITFGIAWIGASFYFVFLENALNRTVNVRDELAGNLWAVHGGGFYYLEKYKGAPGKIPNHLHWFKYEAYFTWLSGFCLLFIVYYFNASAMLIDKSVLDISPLAGMSIGVGSFVIAWIIYDLMCKSPLKKNMLLFSIIGIIVAVLFAYGYHLVFSSRAAYIHFGAMLGGIMAANVFFVIIPSQKAMVKAAKEGTFLDPSFGKNALMRSIHNNYFTLPVLFVMISNHFPSTFGNKYAWVVLLIITIGTAGVKHWLNIKEKGKIAIWVLPISIIIILAAAFITAPQKSVVTCNTQVTDDQAFQIIKARCVSCHSSKPTDPGYTAPPNGIVYNSIGDISRLKERVMQRVVITKTMPQNNKTNMTDEERNLIKCWIEQSK